MTVLRFVHWKFYLEVTGVFLLEYYSGKGNLSLVATAIHTDRQDANGGGATTWWGLSEHPLEKPIFEASAFGPIPSLSYDRIFDLGRHEWRAPRATNHRRRCGDSNRSAVALLVFSLVEEFSQLPATLDRLSTNLIIEICLATFSPVAQIGPDRSHWRTLSSATTGIIHLPQDYLYILSL